MTRGIYPQTEAKTHTHQVDVRHKVSEERKWNSGSPHGISRHLEDGEIEKFLWRTKLSPGKEGESAALTLFLFGAGNKRSVSKASQEEHKHEDAEDSQCVKEAHTVGQVP